MHMVCGWSGRVAGADAGARLTQESYMDSVRWDTLRIAGMENGWLVDPDEVRKPLPLIPPSMTVRVRQPLEFGGATPASGRGLPRLALGICS